MQHCFNLHKWSNVPATPIIHVWIVTREGNFTTTVLTKKPNLCFLYLHWLFMCKIDRLSQRWYLLRNMHEISRSAEIMLLFRHQIGSHCEDFVKTFLFVILTHAFCKTLEEWWSSLDINGRDLSLCGWVPDENICIPRLKFDRECVICWCTRAQPLCSAHWGRRST